ncbi:MAG: zinc ribbon domain-containing protein [Sedimenticola sp.]
MKKCPECGRNMRLHRELLRGTWRREWSCRSVSLSGKHCYGAVAIPGDERLTISAIADDMALQSFSGSYAQGKKQAGFRRIAGGLRNLREGRDYLSDDEHQVLMKSIEILERLGSVAEKAKKVKKQLEDAEKRRLEERSKTASKLASARFGTSDVLALAVNTLALADVLSTAAPFRAKDVDYIFNRADEGGLKESLSTMIKDDYGDVLQTLVGGVAYKDEPVEALIDRVGDAFDERREAVSKLNQLVIERIEVALMVAASSNVARLGKKR